MFINPAVTPFTIADTNALLHPGKEGFCFAIPAPFSRLILSGGFGLFPQLPLPWK